jgi:hypothetical protein
MGFYAESGSNKIGYPNVVTNASIKYECQLELFNTSTPSAGHLPTRSAVRVKMVARKFHTDLALKGYTCSDKAHGLVYQLSIKPGKTVFPGDTTDKKYYIDVEFPTGTTTDS